MKESKTRTRIKFIVFLIFSVLLLPFTGNAQPRYMEIGNLPAPASTERGEVFDAATGSLFSFAFYPQPQGQPSAVYVSQPTAGDAFAWGQTTSFPGGAYWGRGASDGTNIYFTGTINGVSEYARILPGSLLGAWQPITPLPNPSNTVPGSQGRALHQTFIYRGKLYILGGWYADNHPAYSTVYYAPILAGGALGSFAQTTSLPIGMCAHSATVSSNGTVYVAYQTNLFSAQIAADGSIGQWFTQATVTGMNHGNGGNTAMSLIGDLLVIVDNANTFVCHLGKTGQFDALLATIINPANLSERSVYTYNGKVYVTATTGKIYRIDGLPSNSVAPAITQQSQSQKVVAGGNVTLSVTATGTSPLAYKWLFKGEAITGANSSSLVLNGVSNANAGSYTVEVSNLAGSVKSADVVLTVDASISNQALRLDGNDSYVTIPSAPDLQNPTEITVEAWIKPGGTSDGQFFIGKSDSGFVDSARTYQLTWNHGDGGRLDFSLFLGTSTWVDLGATAPAGDWIHVAATYSSVESTMRLYTNGILAGATVNDASGMTLLNGQTLRQTTLPLVFGAELTHPMGFATGDIDEVRIWKVARSAQEIAGDPYVKLTGNETNLAAYWNFDDGTANDQTGHGHNGTIVGSALVIPMDLPMQITPPVVNQRVLTLNGNADYVTIPGSTALKATNEITIESWIYPVPSNNNPNAFFLSKGAGSNLDSSRTFELSWTPDNRAYFSLFTGQSAWSLLGAPVAESQWTHIAATFNGSDGWFRLYTNGILAAATTNDVTGQFPLKGQSLRENSLPLAFGCSFNGAPVTGTFATGQMDEVRVWDRALSGPEILQNISRRLSGTELNLIGYWNFDNGTANDGSNENHNGTLSGNAETVAMEGLDIIHDVIGVTGTSFSRRGEIVLDIAARNGVYIRVDASTNMVAWKPIGTNQVVGGTIQFLDPDTLKYQQRFYRAVLP